jgi:hypothetical protein
MVTINITATSKHQLLIVNSTVHFKWGHVQVYEVGTDWFKSSVYIYHTRTSVNECVLYTLQCSTWGSSG